MELQPAQVFRVHRIKMAQAKRRVIIQNILAIMVGTFLCGLAVVAFEFFFSPYRHLPINGFVNGKRYTWGHLVENNRYGFRERNFQQPKPSDTYRVMVLGDSLTWGVGLSVDERYTAIAEKLLNEAFPEKNFEVLNFGMPEAPTTKERDVLAKLKDDVKPDLIVVGFCLNDPQQKRMDYSIEREKLSSSIIGRAVKNISYSLVKLNLPYTGKLLNDAFYRSAERVGLIPNWQGALARVYDPSSNAWLEFVEALRDIRAVSDEMSLPPPIFATLNSGNPFTSDAQSKAKYKLMVQWFHQAEKAASDIGFVSYNHEVEIANQLRNEPLKINKLDNHPSASVTRVYGEKLYHVITKHLTQWGALQLPRLAPRTPAGKISLHWKHGSCLASTSHAHAWGN
jgi:lysophospholipase L1-like esterase